jgi:hypothetical protein
MIDILLLCELFSLETVKFSDSSALIDASCINMKSVINKEREIFINFFMMGTYHKVPIALSSIKFIRNWNACQLQYYLKQSKDAIVFSLTEI